MTLTALLHHLCVNHHLSVTGFVHLGQGAQCSVHPVPCSVYITLVLCGDCPGILCVCSTLTCSTVDVCLGCFYLSNIVNDGALSVNVYTNFMINDTVFDDDHTMLHSHRQYTRVSIFLPVSMLGTFLLFILSLVVILISTTSVGGGGARL